MAPTIRRPTEPVSATTFCVEDLATAHLDALAYLRSGGPSTVLNCGYGHGYSVREVIDAVDAAHHFDTPRRTMPCRRPAHTIARADCIRQVLGWQPRHDDLGFIVKTALAWEQKLQSQPPE
ncbi:MAG: hypothetical protein R3F24_02090 [Gammaproteobacteria bacterium]